MKWYEGSKEEGVIRLCNLFHVERADWFILANKFRNKENKATKKKHEHIVRPCGSKSLKKYNRYAWNKLYNE